MPDAVPGEPTLGPKAEPDLEVPTAVRCAWPEITATVGRTDELVVIDLGATLLSHVALAPRQARMLALALLWRAHTIDGQEFRFSDVANPDWWKEGG